MMIELNNMIEGINEYKLLQLKDAKYKEITDKLVKNVAISQTSKEIIKF